MRSWIILAIMAFPSLQAMSLGEMHGRAISQNRLLLQQESNINQNFQLYQQSQKLTNPQFNVTVDGFGHGEDCDDNEISYQLSQLVELGGKRGLRRSKAQLGWMKAKYQHEIVLQTLLNQLSKAYFEASYKEEKIKIQEKRVNLLEDKKLALSEKVNIGSAKAFDLRQTTQLQRLQLLEIKKQEKELEHAYRAIQLLIDEEIDSCESALLKETIDLSDCSDEHPYLELLKIEREELYAQYQLERAKRIPDVVVTGGYTQSFKSSDDYFIFGLDFPLPIFDQNQGNICAASLEIEKKDFEYEAAQKWLKMAREKESLSFENTQGQIELLENEILKESEAQIELLEKAGVDKTEIIDAKLSHLDIEDIYLDTLKELHERAINLKFLIYEG